MTGAADRALSVSNLRVAYEAVLAVRGVSLTVGRSEAVAVIGSNGAGKTSMLRGIMRLIDISVDHIEFFGKSTRDLSTYELARFGVGYVPEGRELFPGLTVEEELKIGGRLLAREERSRKIEEVYKLFPRLKERNRQITRTLSGGEQQMCAIARTLMSNPKILLLDEPSLGLAPLLQDIVYETLEMLRENGLPILLVEQNAFRALKLCKRAYVLELGQITRESSSEELLNDPGIQAAYLGK